MIRTATMSRPCSWSCIVLPVECRITIKTLVLTLKCLHSLSPPYLSALLSHYCPTRCLLSSDKLLLKLHTSRTKIGGRAFQGCGTNCPSHCVERAEQTSVVDSIPHGTKGEIRNYRSTTDAQLPITMLSFV